MRASLVRSLSAAVVLALVLSRSALAHAASAPSPAPTDTDSDGLPDSEEDRNHDGKIDPGETDPKEHDSDRDNVPDAVERRLGTDPMRKSDVPPIPEPLLFDLVRNLGSKRGELEVNALTHLSLRAPRDVAWAPEVEYAFADGYAIELELPFHGDVLESVKGGIQATLGRFWHDKAIHGVQALGERALRGGSVDAALLYLVGARVGSYVSLVGMVGPTLSTFRDDPRLGAGVVFNPSVFVQLASTVTVGIEGNFALRPRSRPHALAMPEVHWSPIRNTKLQMGIGIATDDGRAAAVTAFRASIEL